MSHFPAYEATHANVAVWKLTSLRHWLNNAAKLTDFKQWVAQRITGWPKKTLLETIQSKPCSDQALLEQDAQGHNQLDFEYPQKWRLHSFSVNPVPVCSSVSCVSLWEIVLFKWHFLYFSLFPLPPILSLSNTEKSLAPSSFLHSSHICIDGEDLRVPPLLQAEQFRLSWPLLLWQMFQSLNRLNGSLLLYGIHY